ncbi:MAG: DUF4855 domain-containing protein, partial [Clostridia bacterium]|nr:DUF4855 domain-containing protein [Clostridia bacterium]
MKRHISYLLIIALLASIFSMFNVTVGADFTAISDMNGYENLCLTYTWNPDRADNGQHTEADLLPYAAYLDKSGNVKDFFFDSFLFLPCVKLGASGGSMHYNSSKPTKAIDWTSYIEDTFKSGVNVSALNSVFGKVKTQLNAPDKKAGVFFTILYPNTYAGKNFGSLGGREVDMSKIEDRKYAVKWMIDEQLRLYTQAGYENLDLLGFYWLEEWLSKDDKELLNYTSEYLHSLGLTFLWIPYYRANEYKSWQNYGFDIACMQPNMYWDLACDKERVFACAEETKELGMCVEIEIDNFALTNGVYYNKYLDYLAGCMETGAMNSVKMYYQGGKEGVYYGSCYSSGIRARSIYDLTYKYAKGILTQDDLKNNYTEVFELPKGVDWVSIGKEYVATAPYSTLGSTPYLDNDGTELTDGVIWGSFLGTEWHAYHVSNRDSDGRMSVTIDLGWVRSDLTNFIAIFSNADTYGIGDPKNDVKIYISEDGTNFNLIAQPQLEESDIITYVSHETAAVTARYVKFSFINSDKNFVFCSEALVGVKDGVVGDVTSGKMNVARGKTYTTEGIYVSNGVASYPDENGVTLTDSKFPTTSKFSDPAFVGFNKTTEAIKANGYATVSVDLGRSYALDVFTVTAGSEKLSGGISAPLGIEVYVSNDNENWTFVGDANYRDSNILTCVDATVALAKAVTARYVQYRIIPQSSSSYSWMFLCEVSAYSSDLGDVTHGKVNVARGKKYTSGGIYPSNENAYYP